jgi:predicted small integral membrane protein
MIRSSRSPAWGDSVITSNPFAELSVFIPPIVMQIYVGLMIVFVAGGTLYDTIHKRSAEYFFKSWREAAARGVRKVRGKELISLAFQTALEGLASAEFCNVRRRIAHLLAMYGFLSYVITTAIMVFAYPTSATPTPSILPQLWCLGALMICVGGYWFWFFIRVDVAAEGNSPFRIVRADLFILSLLASATLALIWGHAQAADNAWSSVVLGAYLLATTVLFGSVPWSKFSHMFFKPAAAFEKRVAEANGSRRNLPHPAVKPEVFGNIKRRPRNYGSTIGRQD